MVVPIYFYLSELAQQQWQQKDNEWCGVVVIVRFLEIHPIQPKSHK